MEKTNNKDQKIKQNLHLQLTKEASFNTYAKQLSPLKLSSITMNSAVLNEPRNQPEQEQRCLNFEEILRKVKENQEINFNLFDQLISSSEEENLLKKSIQLEMQVIESQQSTNKDEKVKNNLVLENLKSLYHQISIKSDQKIENLQDIKTPLSKQSSTPKIIEQKMEKEIVPEKIICNCKKSKCLKLYCECFIRMQFCDKTCNCHECKNTVQFQERRQKTIDLIKEKNPNAFQVKLDTKALTDQTQHRGTFSL